MQTHKIRTYDDEFYARTFREYACVEAARQILWRLDACGGARTYLSRNLRDSRTIHAVIAVL